MLAAITGPLAVRLVESTPAKISPPRPMESPGTRFCATGWRDQDVRRRCLTVFARRGFAATSVCDLRPVPPEPHR